MNSMTQHAAIRSQQRGLSALQVDLLLQFGSTESAAGGASKIFMDKEARKRIRAYAGALAGALEEHLDLYVVMGADGQIITVAHRQERIRRH